MNQILVLKAETYLAGTGGTIANLKDINTLKQGAFGVVLDGKALLTDTTATATAPNYKRLQIVAGIAKGTNNVGSEVLIQSSVPIERRSVLSVNYEKYKASVNEVRKVTFALNDAVDVAGDCGFVISNNSFVGTIRTDKVSVNVFKTKTDTLATLITKLVTAFNNTPINRVATISASDATSITFTMKNEHVNFSVAVNGGIYKVSDVVTTKPVISLGKGEDVLRTEKDYSGNLGNGGYWGYNEGYFSKPTEAVSSENYDLFHIKWQGEHDTPQNRVRAAINYLTIAVPTTATAAITALKAVLENLIGTAFTSATGQIVMANEEADETNQTVDSPTKSGV